MTAYDRWKLATPYSNNESCDECGYVDCECEKGHECRHCVELCDCGATQEARCIECAECRVECGECGI